MAPKFKLGSRVRVLDEVRPGHIRTPTWLFGRPGIVSAIIGEFPDPERLAYHQDGLPPVPLYHVALNPADVWGKRSSEASANTKIVVELYEHWVEPA